MQRNEFNFNKIKKDYPYIIAEIGVNHLFLKGCKNDDLVSKKEGTSS